ncbi:hypothetical protein B296_00050608 [Ensete ventricosum]|uniref:Transmembrane protein n=1 Tax=Ensete ventricosum TaxID=4639 RepID=A0A426YKK5_ENSVE|nr:hypothetical protein B296_00050608 [Ensete ventricosum]
MDEDGDRLLLELAPNFHCLWVCVAGKSMHYAIGWLWPLFRILLFIIKVLFFMLKVLFNGFDHKESPFLAMVKLQGST